MPKTRNIDAENGEIGMRLLEYEARLMLPVIQPNKPVADINITR
jgi:hypothetical protein